MAHKIQVQDGIITYSASAPTDALQFNVAGEINVHPPGTVGDGVITTIAGNDITLSTDPGGNITLEPGPTGSVFLISNGTNAKVVFAGDTGDGLITASNGQNIYIDPRVGSQPGPLYGALILMDNQWPSSDGTAGQVLTTNGAGVLSFSNPGIITGVTDNNINPSSVYPTWITSTSGNSPQYVSSTKLTFVPATGILSAVSFSATSTKRVKTQIRPISNEYLSKFTQLLPREYDRTDYTAHEFGFIAEEMNMVYPEIVGKDDNNLPSGIDYAKLVTILTAKIQEQDTKISDIYDKISLLNKALFK